jgi:hypothetical protein
MYKYDDYDYYTEHESISEKEKKEVLNEITKEDFFIKENKCA